ncbi:MAG: hypothetical protein CM1200mP1_08900 [Candidatus Neomarinimicrobiota bacterium]|nr:MAG: hypothetical protein CM1200mP1_08900 [Candidatus Neomarinimicrobiota bacterium]
MLAIKSVLKKKGPVGTLVFDEIEQEFLDRPQKESVKL